jgi:glycoside/pentoside/hexuronide:cation symporter, GPH family
MSTVPASNASRAGGISLARLVGFSSTSVPIAALLLMSTTYLPRFFAANLAVSMGTVAAAFTVVRLIDIAFDPAIGIAMDRTRSRFGRYRLWYVIGMPILAGSVYMLFNPQPGAGFGYLVVWLLIYYAGLSIAMLAHAAWASTLATHYHERSMVYGVMHAVSVLGSVGLLLLPAMTGGRIEPGNGASMGAISWILIALLPITAIIMLMSTGERVAPEAGHRPQLRDYWRAIAHPTMARMIWVDLALTLGPGTTAPIYIFFFHDARGYTIPQISFLLVPFILAGLFGAPFWGWLAIRFSKHRTLQLATVCYCVSLAALIMLPRANMTLMVPAMFVVGFVSSAFIFLVRAMVADIADEVRLDHGNEQTSLLYAMVTATQKVGAAISVIIIFPILDLVGFKPQEGAINTPQAIFGLEMCYMFAPLFFVLVGGALLFGYRLDAKRHGAVRAALELRDAAAGEPPAASALPPQLADAS